jgi:hypothetical protein
MARLTPGPATMLSEKGKGREATNAVASELGDRPLRCSLPALVFSARRPTR